MKLAIPLLDLATRFNIVSFTDTSDTGRSENEVCSLGKKKQHRVPIPDKL